MKPASKTIRLLLTASAAAHCALVAPLHAQDLAPELAPLAAKYKADTAALGAQKEAAITRVALVYSAALDSAEKTETTAGHLPALTAITLERGDLKKNEVKPELPSDLPKGLHSVRKAYLDDLARVVADFAQRQQRIAADDIRVLSSLQTRAGSNAALAKQIMEEKERVLQSATAGSAAEFEHRLIGTKWNWNDNFPVTFEADGTSSGANPYQRIKWKSVKPFTLEYSFSNGNHGTIEFERGMTRAAIVEINESGEKHPMTLVRVKK